MCCMQYKRLADNVWSLLTIWVLHLLKTRFFYWPAKNTAMIFEYCKSVLQLKVLWFSIKLRYLYFKEPVHFRLLHLLQNTSFTLLLKWDWSVFPEDLVTRGALRNCTQIVQSMTKPCAGSLFSGTESQSHLLLIFCWNKACSENYFS